jgi:serine O-acetyltransferase
MIQSRKDYLYYLEADRIALGKPKYSFFEYLKEIMKREFIWRFQRSLRQSEYYRNVVSEKSIIGKIIYMMVKIQFKNISIKLGFSIPENVFGPGLAIVHYGTIVVNSDARIGANCRIHACTNIGRSGGISGAPILGDNIYIGPGAKIFGNISIADNCAIAANAAVNKSVIDRGVLIAGVPARVIKQIDIKNIITHI